MISKTICGDCIDVMHNMDPNSVDAIITDPPYGLQFMGRDWDIGVPGIHFWIEALRVAKPGAYLLAFGGTRKFHRLACAIEDAGWELKDTIMWVYGEGFPRGLNVSLAIDREAGVEREVVGQRGGYAVLYRPGEGKDLVPPTSDITVPATDTAKKWVGWNTSLKPAWEPILVCRKPVEGTVAENVQKWGTGAINIDNCRVGDFIPTQPLAIGWGKYYGDRDERSVPNPTSPGRWPANLILSWPEDEYELRIDTNTERMEELTRWLHENAESESIGDNMRIGEAIYNRLSEQLQRLFVKLDNPGRDEILRLFPNTVATKPIVGTGQLTDTRGQGWGFRSMGSQLSDSGGSAVRFFYVAKASSSDRNEGLDGAIVTIWHFKCKKCGHAYSKQKEKSMCHCKDPEIVTWTGTSKNFHPTVKPTMLMRYLCRLVTPPGGVILDPFAGSGSTGKAAVMDGFNFVGIDIDPEYCDIAERRIRAQMDVLDLFSSTAQCQLNNTYSKNDGEVNITNKQEDLFKDEDMK